MNDSGPDDPTLLIRWSRDHCERSFRLLVERYAGLVHQAATSTLAWKSLPFAVFAT